MQTLYNFVIPSPQQQLIEVEPLSHTDYSGCDTVSVVPGMCADQRYKTDPAELLDVYRITAPLEP